MQVSAALVQSLEELLQTAVTRLTAEIKAETNPQRLDTLLTLAFRARLPRIPAPPRTSPDPYLGRAFGSERARDPEATQPICKTDPPSSSLSTDRANGAEPRASEGEAAQSRKIDRSVCKTAPCPEPVVNQSGLQDRSSSTLPASPLPQPGRANETQRAQEPEVTHPSLQDLHQNPPPRLSSRDTSLVPHTSASPNTTNTADDVEDEVADEDEHAPTDEGLPHYLTPMTDAEFIKLQREIGHVEANRRRLIRAHLASNHARNAADSS